jgi:Mobilization protein NikA
MAGSDKRRRLRQSLVRWTDEEFNAVAAFMRAAALGDAGPRAQRRPPADHKALRQILGELGRVGNNLNQIARALNAGEQARLPELKDALRAYMTIRDAIFAALGKKPGAVP